MKDLGAELRNERQRLEDLHAVKLRNVSPGRTIEVMMELNAAMHELAIYQIRKENPDINNVELTKKLRELFLSGKKWKDIGKL